jgi:hypothetical protein
VSGRDFRFPTPLNHSAVRIRVGFVDCRGESETAGTAGSATSQPPVLLSSVMLGPLELSVPQRVQQTSTDLELLSVVRTALRHSICIGSA